MIAKRWGRGRRVVGALAGGLAVVLVPVLAGCEAAPPPERAPRPTAPVALPSKPTTPATPGSTPTPGSAAKVPGAPGPECPEGGFLLSEDTGDSAMGLRVQNIRLANCGTAPLVLDGYPDLRLQDKDGAPVQVHVGKGANGVATGTGFDRPAQKVVLQPGEAASFGLLWRNLVTEVDTPAVNGWFLDVMPAPGRPRQVLKLEGPVDLGNTGKLGISPWTKEPR
ncbi:DUF4232 domain-containing protein [Streptomyces sp. NPDC002054]|uniref:DUF4232 domain-containing protein n=1 Tax=Streptomyces sp. NPDC002054 TaxID=3154663 RepID=UPI00331B583B